MKKHYEKVICACCFLVLFCNVGLASTSFAVYQPYIVAIPGIGDAGGSAVQSIRLLASMTAMVFADRYFEKFDVRLGMFMSMLLMSCAFMIYSFADGLAVMLTGAVVAGIAYGLGAMIGVTLLISRWYSSGIGAAVGFASVGSGVAGTVIPIMVTRIAESFSLATAFRSEALIAFALAFVVFAFVRNRPADMGLMPYESKKAVASSAKRESDASDKRLPKSARVLLLVAMGFVGAVAMTSMTYYSVLLVSENYDIHFAAMMLSASGITLTIAKFGVGEVFDRVGPRRATLLMFSVLLVGLAGCILTFTGSEVIALAAALLVGAGLSIGSVGTSVWSLDLSDVEHRTKSIKNCQTAYASGGFVMNMVPGPLKVLSGSYLTSYVLIIALTVVTLAILMFLYRRYRS